MSRVVSLKTPKDLGASVSKVKSVIINIKTDCYPIGFENLKMMDVYMLADYIRAFLKTDDKPVFVKITLSSGEHSEMRIHLEANNLNYITEDKLKGLIALVNDLITTKDDCVYSDIMVTVED